MKNLLCFVVLSAVAVNLVAGFPKSRGSSSEEDSLEETVVVPLEAQREQQSQPGASTHIVIGGFGPPLDFGAPLVGGFGPQGFNEVPYGGYPGLVPQPPAPSFFSGFNPFAASDPGLGGPNTGFLGGLESGLALMRRQLAALLNHVPGVGPAGAPNDGNTTSTTKVIDGHRITINETVYGNGFDGSVFKVRVVDVQPASSSEDSTTTSPKDETEDMGKQIDSSESTTQDSNASGDAEDVEEEDSRESAEKISNDITQRSDEDDEEEEATKTPSSSEEEFEDNISTVKISDERENFDTINSDEITSTPKPHSESFENEFEKFQRDPEAIISEQARPETWESFEHLHGPQYDDLLESNDVQLHDIPEVPVDLTNDIAVNDFLAHSGATHNPNAEIIEVFGDQNDESNDEFSGRELRSLSSMPLK